MKIVIVMLVCLAALWSGLAVAQCPPMDAQVTRSDHVSCVVFDRQEALELGVPRSLKLRTLAACVRLKPERPAGTMLVYGTDRRGRIRCEGAGEIDGADWEACGLLW